MDIRKVIWFTVLILAACQTNTPSAQPALPPEIWQVQFSPTLQWIEPGLNLCSNRQANIGLVTFERPPAELDVHPADITLRWGAPEHLNGHAAVLAYDDLALVVNAHNPIQTLNQTDVQAIYEGKITNWKVFNPSPSFDQQIQAWRYSDGEETQQIFKNELVKDLQNIEAAGIAPSPEYMVQIIAANVGAIGYIPQRWLNQSIRKVSLLGNSTNSMQVPILAITNSEPTSQQKLWLACLQSTLMP